MSPYLLHLLVWFVPLILLQWAIGWRILLGNLRAVIAGTLIGGVYYSLTDVVAILQGIWFFGDDQITGLHIGPVPIEEILFFTIVSWLVAQSFILLLPERFRHAPFGSQGVTEK